MQFSQGFSQVEHENGHGCRSAALRAGNMVRNALLAFVLFFAISMLTLAFGQVAQASALVMDDQSIAVAADDETPGSGTDDGDGTDDGTGSGTDTGDDTGDGTEIGDGTETGGSTGTETGGNAGTGTETGDADDAAPLADDVFPSVSYVDDKGNVMEATDVTRITEDTTTLNTGWYFVMSAFQINHALTVTGDVNIILQNACDVTIQGGIRLGTGASLTIWSQSQSYGTTGPDAPGSLYVIAGAPGGEGGAITLADDATTTASGGVTINGGIISATTKVGNGPGIGGGLNSLVINNGSVTAIGSNAPGIGAWKDDMGSVTINGGTVNATGGVGGAGIGSCAGLTNSKYQGWLKSVTINGGTVYALGGPGAAGIGGAGDSAIPTITIDNSIGGNTVVEATGAPGGTFELEDGSYITAGPGAGLGSGDGSSNKGSVTIKGGTVTATGGSAGSGPVGGAPDGSAWGIGDNTGDSVFQAAPGGNAFVVTNAVDGTVSDSAWSGVLISGNEGRVYGNPTVSVDAEVPNDATLTIEPGQTLTVDNGVRLTNFGTIVNDGTLQNNGVIRNGGKIEGENAVSGTAPIDLPDQDAPPAPVVIDVTSDMVQLKTIEAEGHGTLQYGYAIGNGTPGHWQTGNVFSKLTPSTTYTFYARFTGNADWREAISAPSEAVTTDAAKYKVTVIDSKASQTGAGNYAPGDKVVIDAGTRLGYSFAGWRVEPTGAVTINAPSSAQTYFTMPSESVTIYAEWKPWGKVTNVTDVDKNYLNAQFAQDENAVAANMFASGSSEMQKLVNGTALDVWVESSSDGIGSVDKALIEAQAHASSYTIAGYLNLTLWQQFAGAAKVQVTEANGAISIKIVLPESWYKTAAGYVRSFKVITAHNNTVKVLDATYENDKAILTFSSSQFSPFAVVYTDTVKPDDPDNPSNPDDPSNPDNPSNPGSNGGSGSTGSNGSSAGNGDVPDTTDHDTSGLDLGIMLLIALAAGLALGLVRKVRA